MPWEYIKEFLDELQVEAEWASKDLLSQKAEKGWDAIDYLVMGKWLSNDEDEE